MRKKTRERRDLAVWARKEMRDRGFGEMRSFLHAAYELAKLRGDKVTEFTKSSARVYLASIQPNKGGDVKQIFIEVPCAIAKQRERISKSPRSDGFRRSPAWRKLRTRVLNFYGPICMCCGASPKTGSPVNVDHIKPFAKYPRLALEFDNLQVLCEDCNIGKGAWDETDWRPHTRQDKFDELPEGDLNHMRDIIRH